MKRGVIACVAGLLVGVCVLSGTAALAASSRPPRAQLRSLKCQTALDPPARAVAITAVMKPLDGTRKMALRFVLLAKPKTSTVVTPVPGGDLGTWISPPNPTLGQRSGDTWIVNKQVVSLEAPDAYRFRVDFRWTGAHGRMLGTATKYSATCHQPELRPDVAVAAITVMAINGHPAHNAYVAAIANTGATASGPFIVQFVDGAAPAKTVSVPGLDPHSRTRVRFVGPACDPAAPPTVTADPAPSQVDDFNRANNTLTATCP